MARTFPSLCIAAVLAVPTFARANEADEMIRVSTVAVGSSFVREIRDSGSYGNGATTVTMTRRPNREWKGQTVGVWDASTGPTLLIHPVRGDFVAFVNGDQPVISFEPAAGWEWPLKVGKSWTRKLTTTMHATNQSVTTEAQVTVEAYEDVTTPAGTFKAWRVRSLDDLGNDDLHWVNTGLTVLLKQKLTRTAKHPAGAGVRETELLSQAIRHQ